MRLDTPEEQSPEKLDTDSTKGVEKHAPDISVLDSMNAAGSTTREALDKAKANARQNLSSLSRMTSLVNVAYTSQLDHYDETFDPEDPRYNDLRDRLTQNLLSQTANVVSRHYAHSDSTESHSADRSSDGEGGDEVSTGQISFDVAGDTMVVSSMQHQLIVANLRRAHRFECARRLKQSRRAVLTALHESSDSCLGQGAHDETEQLATLSTSAAASKSESIAHEKDRCLDTDSGIQATVDAIDTVTAGPPSLSSEERWRSQRTGILIRYPAPPRLGPKSRAFPCPYCGILLPRMFADDRSEWRFVHTILRRYPSTDIEARTHVQHDIAPYTCLLSNCPTSNRLHVNEEAWQDHMHNDHNLAPHWECIFPNCPRHKDGTVYATEAQYASHFHETHHPAPGITGNSRFFELCVKTSPVEIAACPLCDWMEKHGKDLSRDMLLEHVAEHVHEFALRSLPEVRDCDYGVDEEEIRDATRRFVTLDIESSDDQSSASDASSDHCRCSE